MKHLIDILEASRNEKAKATKGIEKMFLNGKEYGNIRNFGIMTSQNPYSGAYYDGFNHSEKYSFNQKLYDDFKKILKDARIKFTPVDGKFGNLENTFIIFNVTVDNLIKWCAKYEQSSFFYCYPKDGKMNCEYWEKTDVTKPYNKDTNPYYLIETTTRWTNLDKSTKDYYTAVGNKFKFSINCKYFENANNEIEIGLTKLCEGKNLDKDEILNFSINGTGLVPWNYRNTINKNPED